MKKIFSVIFILLLCPSAQAQELSEIEHYLYCGIFSYQTLKTQIVTKTNTFQQEIEGIDKIGAFIGKARQLTLEKHGSKSGYYEVYRNNAIKSFNKKLKYINQLSTEEQRKAGYDIGVECGQLYTRTQYTDEDYEKGQQGFKKIKDLLNVQEKSKD